MRDLTDGGTLEALVLDLSEFIRTGEPTNGNNGYNGIFCRHENWGYSIEEMEEIRAYAKEIGFVKGGRNGRLGFENVRCGQRQ